MGHALERLVWIKVPWSSYRWVVGIWYIIIFRLLYGWFEAPLWRLLRFLTVLAWILHIRLFMRHKRWPVFINFNCLILVIWWRLSGLISFYGNSWIEACAQRRNIIFPQNTLHKTWILLSVMWIQLAHNIGWAKWQMLVFVRLLLLNFALFWDG